MLDKRLVLRMFLLIIQALEYHITSTVETNPQHKEWFQNKATSALGDAKSTLARMITLAGYTLAKLEKD